MGRPLWAEHVRAKGYAATVVIVTDIILGHYIREITLGYGVSAPPPISPTHRLLQQQTAVIRIEKNAV